MSYARFSSAILEFAKFLPNLMTVIDIVIVNDFIEDLRVPIVIGVIKTLNHVEISF